MTSNTNNRGHRDVTRPRHLSDRKLRKTSFDRFAGRAADFASHGQFFAGCVLLCVLWAPSILVIGRIDTWQLIINTATTIVTFLMVALLQNTQRRSEQAIHAKLNALARGVEDLLEYRRGSDVGNVEKDIRDVRTALGLEQRT